MTMRTLILIPALCLFLMGCPVPNTPHPAPPPVPEPTPIETEMKALVAEVEPFSVPELVPFYRDFADILRRDETIVRTTGDIREAYTRAGRLAFQRTGLQDRTAGLGEKVDSALAKAIGLQNVSLTPELRERAVAAFEAIAWAVE